MVMFLNASRRRAGGRQRDDHAGCRRFDGRGLPL